jgi:pilus assembly protein CpaF
LAINPQCHLICVTGGKGGVGKSVLAANLALAFQFELRQQVLLIDADAKSCGDQNVIMGLKPVKNLSEVSAFTQPITPQTLGQIATPHQSGLYYIAAVRGPEEALVVDPELMAKQTENLSRIFKFIVVDIGHDIGPLQLSFIMEASAVLVVSAPDLLVVSHTQRLINELLTNTIPLDLMQLVINKMGSAGLNPQAIAQSLRIPILGTIPLDDITVSGSVQRSTPFVYSTNQAPVSAAHHELVRKLTGGILQRLKQMARPKGTAAGNNTNMPVDADQREKIDPRTLLKLKTHSELIKAMDLKKGITDTQGDPAKEKALNQKTLQSITVIVDREAPNLARDERSKVIKEVLDEALGLGPLEDLLADQTVTEIMVNGHRRIFIERSGKVQLTPVTFTSNLHLRNVIERIVTPLGRRIDEKTPYVDARLKDGSRVNAIIEPLSIDGPALTIRKFKKGGITPEKYLEYGSMTKPMVDFLKICVENGLNVVISGGTGSGKTSLLNMISSFIPSNERIVTVEDAAELQMQQEHVVRLETRPANMEGTGAVHIRDLIKNALRMRPDRIVVGECRDGAALDMLQAMNTGHDGSMTTTHANSPRECIARLETLCMMAGMDLPVRAIRDQVASAVNLIVQISRLSDGSRKIISITEVVGMQGEVVTLAEIFRFKETGYDKNRRIQGVFQALGHIPTFIEKLEAKGVIIPRDIFSNDPKVLAQGVPAPAAPAGPGAPKRPMPPPPGPVKKSGT